MADFDTAVKALRAEGRHLRRELQNKGIVPPPSKVPPTAREQVPEGGARAVYLRRPPKR
jgi:hypothetical protein